MRVQDDKLPAYLYACADAGVVVHVCQGTGQGPGRQLIKLCLEGRDLCRELSVAFKQFVKVVMHYGHLNGLSLCRALRYVPCCGGAGYIPP